VVDDFLDHLDPVMTRLAASRQEGLRCEFYHLQNKFDARVRALSMNAGLLRWRVFWARIGNGLYLTNQPYIFDDLHAASVRRDAAEADDGPTGQLMLRLRPEHWKAALAELKLGWAENNREACQHNLALLSAAARAFSTTPPVKQLAPSDEGRERLVLEYASKMYGVTCVCPEGGEYHLQTDGKTIRCTVHGTLDKRVQSLAPVRDSLIDRLMREFKDLHATLSVTPAGLRIVLVIEKK
jgi:hypothetical protein